MVWSRDGDVERPPLSVILPRLYLGAERDVTQDGLASLGISYVLSVSRCSPRPSFLPHSRYLRIPIDDSLWADLLSWIPQALHFIDAAMSSGGSVLVHCAAGISRSPALAVAYIMYSLGLDLDQAYRFVKERRPSISPNFNFLGQLQHFQGTLSQKAVTGDPAIPQQDDYLLSVDNAPPCQDSSGTGHSEEVEKTHKETSCPAQRHSDSNQQPSVKSLTVSHNQDIWEPPKPAAQGVCKPDKSKPTKLQLQLPASSASLLERRKSLSLSLTPLGTCPPSAESGSLPAGGGAGSKTIHRSEGTAELDTKTESHRGWRVEELPKEHGVPLRPAVAKEPGLLSPLSFTLNKLLGWGERLLLGGAFVHPVMGQATLPYRC